MPICKGHAAIYNLTQDIRGEAHIFKRASGIGAGALAEAIAVIDQRLELQPARWRRVPQRLERVLANLNFAPEPVEVPLSKPAGLADYADCGGIVGDHSPRPNAI